MVYGFFRYDFQGLDAQGNPIYRGDRITVFDPPVAVKKVARVVYLDDSDTLIVAEEARGMRHIGHVFICRGYLAGKRETVSFESAASSDAGCVAAACDYVFSFTPRGERAQSSSVVLHVLLFCTYKCIICNADIQHRDS